MRPGGSLMAAFSSIALGIGALAAAAGTAQAVRSEQVQRQARYRTRDAQAEALRIQMVERSRSVQEERRADRPTPASTIEDVEAGNPTDRTGGVSERLKLARRSMLGGL